MCRGFHRHALLWGGVSGVLSSRVVMLGSNPCLTTCASFSGAWDKTDNGLYEPHWTTFPRPIATTVGYLWHARKDVVAAASAKRLHALLSAGVKQLGKEMIVVLQFYIIMYNN